MSDIAGSMTPPNRPDSRAHAISSTASVHVVEIDRDASGAPAGRGRAEVGEPAVVAVQRRPHELETFGPVGAGEHRRGQAADEHRTRVGHLGVDALLLEHRESPAVRVAGEHPVGAVVVEPVRWRRRVDTHAGEPARRDRPHRVRIVGLAGVDPAEHRDGGRRQLAEVRRRPRGEPDPHTRRSGSRSSGAAWVSADTTT